MASLILSRRKLTQSLATMAASVPFTIGAQQSWGEECVPTVGQAWERYASPEAAGFRVAGLKAMEQTLYPLPTTSLMIVKAGKVVYTYGDTTEASYLASARKSIMSMLYGKYVESGMINLDRTIGDLGIEEGNGGLLPVEKTARVKDLLISSSGVYFPAGSAGGVVEGRTRGTVKPGEQFVYNNWDFNVAGAIFEKLTGKTVFQALDEDLARPLGFQDFDIKRQRMLGFATNPSRYKAYHLFLSARDMAKLGAVMVQGGRWNGRQIIPEAWVKASTQLRVPAKAIAGGKGGLGYGYLWWIPTEGRKGLDWGGSFLADGNYGQYILGLPALGMTIVHRRAVTDEFAIARNLGLTEANPPGVSNEVFLKTVDMILASRSS